MMMSFTCGQVLAPGSKISKELHVNLIEPGLIELRERTQVLQQGHMAF
nr:hypothetical protein [Aeromonas sp. QDB51]